MNMFSEEERVAMNFMRALLNRQVRADVKGDETILLENTFLEWPRHFDWQSVHSVDAGHDRVDVWFRLAHKDDPDGPGVTVAIIRLARKSTVIHSVYYSLRFDGVNVFDTREMHFDASVPMPKLDATSFGDYDQWRVLLAEPKEADVIALPIRKNPGLC